MADTLTVDPHEVNAGDMLLGHMAAGPVAKVAYHDGVWLFVGHDGLTIATSSVGGRVQVVRERRAFEVLR